MSFDLNQYYSAFGLCLLTDVLEEAERDVPHLPGARKQEVKFLSVFARKLSHIVRLILSSHTLINAEATG